MEWIRVKDRLPERFVSVLGFMSDAGELPPVGECFVVREEFYFPRLLGFYPVTHWMPLPDPPKE